MLEDRHDEARILLERAEIIGVPAEVRREVSEQLEAALWSGPGPTIDDMWPPAPSLHPLPDDPSPSNEPGGADQAADAAIGGADPFAVAVVAQRFERAGRLTAALGVWEQVAAAWPDRADIAAHVADLRFRIDSGAETLQGELMAFGAMGPPPETARPLLLRWRRHLAEAK